ncbi:hypothetical protein [Krasilnikovia sp. M28-CT-15]|uniref:hypothetical protein n=1 Tax=Krasilnikovia sp. M28-CT-15 TaxID=3373540 RepID=UPI003876A0FB
MSKLITRGILGIVVAAMATGGAAATGSASAPHARVVCSAGTRDSSHGWASCTKKSGRGATRPWQLKTRCSVWPVSSGKITGPARVEVTCPWPQKARYSYVQFF